METIELYLKDNGRTERGTRSFRVDDSWGMERRVPGYRDFLETVVRLPNIVQYKIASAEGFSTDERAALDTIVFMKNRVAVFSENQAKTISELFIKD
jgi:hypothetical protein